MIKYNLSWYEVGTRYAIAILLMIPAGMFFIPALMVVGFYIVVSALLGMCPVKALILISKEKLVTKAKTIKLTNTKELDVAA